MEPNVLDIFSFQNISDKFTENIGGDIQVVHYSNEAAAISLFATILCVILHSAATCGDI